MTSSMMMTQDGNSHLFTEDFLRNVYREHVSDFLQTWKPGTIVYYNVTEDSLETLDEILEDNDSTILYDKGSYLPLGVIISCTPLGSNDKNGMSDSITLLSPFFVHNEVNVSSYKAGSKLLKDTNNILKDSIKSFSKAYSKELKFNIATEQDLISIKDNAIAILNGLSTLKGLIINNQFSFDDIIMQGILLCTNEENSASVILGGLGPDITADNFLQREYRQIAANNDYHQLSAEEFFKAKSLPALVKATEQSERDNKADFVDETEHPSLMTSYNYKDFLKRFGTDFIFEYVAPVTVTVKLS